MKKSLKAPKKLQLQKETLKLLLGGDLGNLGDQGHANTDMRCPTEGTGCLSL